MINISNSYTIEFNLKLIDRLGSTYTVGLLWVGLCTCYFGLAILLSTTLLATCNIKYGTLPAAKRTQRPASDWRMVHCRSRVIIIMHYFNNYSSIKIIFCNNLLRYALTHILNYSQRLSLSITYYLLRKETYLYL